MELRATTPFFCAESKSSSDAIFDSVQKIKYVVFMREIPIETLHDKLLYNPFTGNFVWKNTTQWTKEGQIAGTLCLGYIKISVNKIVMPAHRMAWAMHYGAWPLLNIDHINGIRSDNRIENLREATHQQNCMNRGNNKFNKSGFKGVSWHAEGKKWQSHISIGGKSIYLGLFESAEKAHEAYKEAANKAYGIFIRH